MMPPFPEGRFAAIVADPPWRFKSWSGQRAVPSRRRDGDPYPTMTLAELGSLPVAELAAKDAVLFLWAQGDMIDQALLLGVLWGFTFKTTGFIWVKADPGEIPLRPRMGMGHWLRKEAELSLMFTRGHPPRLSRAVREVIIEPAREHSRKPDGAYDRVQRLVHGPHLELFARTRRPGWTAWGDDVDRFGAGA
jgi:N6-adenosine-specific RNA methylase IME4